MLFENVDEAYRKALSTVLKQGVRVKSNHNDSLEVVGFQARIDGNTYPALTCSRNADQAYLIGEFIWTIMGTNNGRFMDVFAPSFTKRFADPNTRAVMSWAYGNRIALQWKALLKKLNKPHDRRAVLRIWSELDLAAQDDQVVPCATTWQFLMSNKKLNMIVSMRSQDSWVGLAYDMSVGMLFLQYVSHLLRVDPGVYVHQVASLHLYSQHVDKATAVVECPDLDMPKAWMPDFGEQRGTGTGAFDEFNVTQYRVHHCVGSINAIGTTELVLSRVAELPPFFRSALMLYALKAGKMPEHVLKSLPRSYRCDWFDHIAGSVFNGGAQ